MNSPAFADDQSKNLPRWVLAVENGIDRLGRGVSWLNLGVVLLTTCSVVLRYGFGQGSIALQDAVLYAHSAAFLVGFSYALKRDAHVRVDIFYQRFSMRGRAFADLLGTILFLLPFCIFLIIVSYSYVVASWAYWEGPKDAGGLPGVFLLKTLIPLSGFLLAMQGMVYVFRSLAVLRKEVILRKSNKTC